MSKQVLSLDDFTLILKVVNEKLDSIKRTENIDKILREGDKLIAEYKSLWRLKNLLENLIKLTHQHEDKGEKDE